MVKKSYENINKKRNIKRAVKECKQGLKNKNTNNTETIQFDF
jgi:hypothetical protein